MYHYAAIDAPNNQQNLRGRDVLDLACGRGGGLSFLCEHF
jgi:predicted RNA methylase